MRHIHLVSIVITVVGAILVGAALAFALEPVWALVGLLLLWAGLVKVVVVALWRRLGLGERPPAPER